MLKKSNVYNPAFEVKRDLPPLLDRMCKHSGWRTGKAVANEFSTTSTTCWLKPLVSKKKNNSSSKQLSYLTLSSHIFLFIFKLFLLPNSCSGLIFNVILTNYIILQLRLIL